MLTRLLKRFRTPRGQTMAEYVMIFSVIAILAFAAYKTIGSSISGYVDEVANFIEGA